MSRDETYQTLLAFGIDHTLAHEAANRYLNKVEAAADWCFGAGSDVRIISIFKAQDILRGAYNELTRSVEA